MDILGIYPVMSGGISVEDSRIWTKHVRYISLNYSLFCDIKAIGEIHFDILQFLVS